MRSNSRQPANHQALSQPFFGLSLNAPPPPPKVSLGEGGCLKQTRESLIGMAVTCFPLSVPLPLIPFPVYAKAICVQTLVTLTRIREENEDQVFRFPSLPFACVMSRFTKPSLFHLLLSCSIFKPF